MCGAWCCAVVSSASSSMGEGRPPGILKTNYPLHTYIIYYYTYYSNLTVTSPKNV